MKAGFWLNYASGKALLVDDHENFLRRPGNGARLGVSSKLVKEACARYTDRIPFLLYVMARAPLMRVRGHLTHVTCEFVADSDAEPLAALRKFAAQNLGEQMLLLIAELGKKTSRTVKVHDLLERTP